MIEKEEWYIFDNYATDYSNILIKEKVKNFIKQYNNNYIFIFGPRGVGKTHLIRSVIRNLSRKDIILYNSINEYPPLRKAEIVILENINFLSAEKLTKTFDWIKNTKASFLLTYRGDINEQLNSVLQNKFGSDNSLYIPEPGYELKKGILESYIMFYNLAISSESIDTILSTYNDWPKPINAIERIVTFAKLTNMELSDVTIPFIIKELKNKGF